MFNSLKEVFIKVLLLRYFDPPRPIRMKIDASGYGVAGIILQLDDNSIYRPVAF